MQNHCSRCAELFKEGEKVTARFTSTYHVLKSNVVFALSQKDMTYIPGTLRHIVCEEA